MDFFNLYPTAILVSGFMRATINDLSTGAVLAVPNDLALLFKYDKCISIKEVLRKSSNAMDRKIIIEYLHFLKDNNLGFFSDIYFSGINVGLNNDFHYPFEISNILIDLWEFDNDVFNKLAQEIREVGIRNLEIRVFCKDFSIEDLLIIYTLIDKTCISSFTLIISNCIVSKYLLDSIVSYRLTKLIIYNSDKEDISIFRDIDVIYTTQSSISVKNCGLVMEKYFTLNMRHYTESLHHNSCLNRKISIDAHGNIKNCPSMTESYGNIRDTTLAEAIEKPGFKKYWNINKDQIAVCKDCEFRYICTDCRAYTEDPHDVSGPEGTNLSKPLKCGYNPYTGEWAEWSTNPLK